MQNYSYACFIWVSDLVCHIQGGTWAEHVWKWDDDENVEA